jgi:capsular exopolysaccharide synthesis family protein
MSSKSPKEAEELVNAIIRAYMAVEVSNSVKGGDEKLAVLEDEYRNLSEKLQRQRKIVRQMAEEFGTSALGGRQDMMLQQVTMLQSDLTKVQTHKLALETQIQMLEKSQEETIPLDKVMSMKNQILNSDVQLSALSNNIAQLEQSLIVANQTLTAENPEIKRRTELLENMKKRMRNREEELTKGFNDMLTKEASRNRDQKLKEAKAELEQTNAYEERLLNLLSKHNAQTIELGRKQLAMQDQKDQFQLTEELYAQVKRRIQELEMGRKRPARISIAYYADSMLAKDKRAKLIAANIFGAGLLGILLALMLDRIDRRVHTPEDITKRIGVRILGTTIASDKVDQATLPDRIADDYQAIRANLGLFNDEKIPHVLVVTSARAQEGKTTFAVNLAISIAKAGTKVLLIDGDLRKPDIGKLLNLSNGSNGVRRVLLGYNSLEECVWAIPSLGLDVLISDGDDAYDAFELLTRPQTSTRLAAICAGYENVIIDTPPVLAVPDALIWAKMADAVVLASYAGQTEGPDMQKALDRLAQVDVKILGTVLNNVHMNSSYNQYGYDYYRGGRSASPRRRSALIQVSDKDDKQEKVSASA